MNNFNCFPPTHHHSAKRITTHDAQQLLAEFLKQTAKDASRHSDALSTDPPPVTPLVLHNLKRVHAGLQGQHLAADLSFKSFGGEGLPDLADNSVPNSNLASQNRKGEKKQDFQEDWQDKDEYEREQAVEQGEVGSRNNALEKPDTGRRPNDYQGEVPAVGRAGKSGSAAKDARRQDHILRVNHESTAALSKDERKQKKKEKRKQEQRAREAERQSSAKAGKSA
ncbi:MAG: hypothetical protein Q9218_000088 [Villophora microphyllina]